MRTILWPALAASLAACSSLSGLGDQLNALGGTLQKYVDSHSSSAIIYQAPNVVTNGLVTIGSTWAQTNSRLQAVKDKDTGAVSYQAVVAVTYMRQGQYKDVRHYQWSNVVIASGTALQYLVVQDAPDVPVLASAIADCDPRGVCQIETLTVGLDAATLGRASRDLLVQVHAGRDANKFPLHNAHATFKPAYVADFLKAAQEAQAKPAAAAPSRQY